MTLWGVYGLVVISISLPDQLLEVIDYLVKVKGYTGRSEFIRDVLREYIEKEIIDYNERSITAILVLTDHSASPGVDQKIIEVIHQYQSLIIAFYHQLLVDTLCLNIALINSTTRELSTLLRNLRSLRGVLGVWATRILKLPQDRAGR